MNRRTELKLDRIKVFSKKYIFTTRYLVRNTLAVMAIGSIAGSAVLAANIIKDSEQKNAVSINEVVKAEKADKVEKAVKVEKAEAEKKTYVVELPEVAFVDDASIEELSVRFEDDDKVLASSNDVNKLTKADCDMSGKYIVATEGLNLRAEGTEEGNILDVLYTGDSGEVVGTDGDWTMISAGSTEGYVKTEFILVDEEASKVAAEAAETGKSYREVIGVDEPVIVADNDTTEATEQQTTESAAPATEAPTEAPTTEAPTEAPTTEAPTEAPTTEAPTTEAPVQASSSDLYLLAAICYGEAGNQGYDGQLAVASVVMNRVRSGSWGSTISSVIYAPGQFAATSTGAFQTALTTGGSESCLRAAQDALNGANNVGGCMSFRPTWNVDTSSLGSYIQIGDHIFF